MSAPLIDPFSPEFLRDPYPYYRKLRDLAPCYRFADRNIWVVSRYVDVAAVLRNHGDFSSKGGLGIDWQPRPMMPMYDPPDHTRLRRLVAPHFTPKAIAAMEAQLEQDVDALIAPMLASGRCDFTQDFAIPLSLGLIARMLGMPMERIRDLQRWSEGALEGLAGILSPQAAQEVERRRKEFISYLDELTAEKTRRPGPDIISALAGATEADRMTHRELLAFCLVLLVAGFETTVVAFSNGLAALLGDREAYLFVRNHPECIPTLIEEFVRYEAPNQAFFRDTTRAVVVAGVEVPAQSKVMVLYGSANRDPRQFDDPDTFRPTRSPNEHMGYGAGIHYCLGAPLARMEMSIAMKAFLERTANMELTGDVVRVPTFLMRRVKHVPILVLPR